MVFLVKVADVLLPCIALVHKFSVFFLSCLHWVVILLILSVSGYCPDFLNVNLELRRGCMRCCLGSGSDVCVQVVETLVQCAQVKSFSFCFIIRPLHFVLQHKNVLHPTFFMAFCFGFASESSFFANLHHFVSQCIVSLVRE